jgi:hypothetical protein
MPRVLGLFILFLVGLGLAAWVARHSDPSCSANPRNTFRPRRSSKPYRSTPLRPDEAFHVMPGSEAETICDAFTGARIDPRDVIWRCMGCQSMYHEASLNALRKDTARACINCESTDQRKVHFEPEQ